MRLATFKGGVHPFDGKDISKDFNIINLEPSGELVFPVSQHIGAPAVPLVKVGDEVLVGQVIAEAGGFVSSNVISSVSGTVSKIEPRRVANGAMVQSIVINNDGQYNAVGDYGKKRDVESLSNEEIKNIIKDAGIVGLGGAGFPTHVKLSPKNPDDIDYVLVNAAECEPYITSDYRMMIEYPEALIGGLKVVLKLFKNAKAVIGIENNKPEAIKKLEELSKNEEKISVCSLYTKYPQGGERSVINAITGRELNHRMLPSDVGCVVQNVSTFMAIYDAVVLGKNLTHRVVTVSGDAVNKPGNFRVRIGTNYNELIEAAGGLKSEPEKLISGGPMMGMALFTADMPVTKTSSSILAFLKDDVTHSETSACIKCARCVDVCPSKIVPVMMMEYALRNDDKNFERINGMECIECGSCAYVCPAKRPLTQAFKHMRQVVAKKRREAAQAAMKDKA